MDKAVQTRLFGAFAVRVGGEIVPEGAWRRLDQGGDAEAAIAALEQVVLIDPLHEGAQRALMRSFATLRAFDSDRNLLGHSNSVIPTVKR
jgi:hypothetical protein